MTAMPRAAWTKLVRRLGWDDNPLRPRSDLMGRWLLPAVIILFVAMCPVVATLTGMLVRADNAAVMHAQRNWRPVTAVLLRAAPGPAQSDHGTNTWLTWTPARWSVAGQSRAGDVPAVAGSRAGSRQTVWLNRAGQVQVPPLTARQVGNRVRADTVMALAALAFVLAGLWLLARRALNRRRLRDWELEWLTVGPLWTHHG